MDVNEVIGFVRDCDNLSLLWAWKQTIDAKLAQDYKPTELQLNQELLSGVDSLTAELGSSHAITYGQLGRMAEALTGFIDSFGILVDKLTLLMDTFFGESSSSSPPPGHGGGKR